MLRLARRPVASLCITLLALNVVDCHKITQQEPRTVIPADGTAVKTDRIRGVTLNDGRQIQFDKDPHASVLGDTLRANVKGQPTAIAVADVQRVWLESIDKGRTTLLVIGTTVGAGAAIGAVFPSPHSREVGLPIGGARRGRGEVGLTVGRARHHGSRVIQPLRE